MSKIKKKSQTQQNSMEFINKIFAILLSIPIIIGPLMRGLFFETEFLGFAIYIGVLSSVYIFFTIKNGIKLFDKPLDWIIAGLFMAYLLSNLNAAYIRDALLETAKVGTYFLVYLMASRISITDYAKNIFLNSIFVSGILVALSGVLTQLGIANFNGAYVNGRIYTSLQYPNTAAAFLSAIFIIGLYLWQRRDNKSHLNWLYSTGNLLMIYAFIGTQSRGGWLLFPFIIALFIALYNGNRVQLVGKIGLLFVISLIAFGLTSSSTGYLGLIIILLGMIALEGLISITRKYQDRIKIFIPTGIALAIWVFILVTIPAGVINYVETDFAKYNLIKNSEFAKGQHIHWSLVGQEGDKREVVSRKGVQWVNITKEEKVSSTWGIVQLIDTFYPEKAYTISFDAFSDLPEGNLQIIIHQVGPDGNNPQINQTINVTSDINRYNFTFTTTDNTEKESLRIYLFAPNNSKAQDLYISKIQLEEAASASPYEKTTYKNQQLVRLVERLKRINPESVASEPRLVFYQDALKIAKDNFLSGVGGSGWANIYNVYQSIPYNTTTTHSHFLEVLIDTGIIGFLLWCGIWLLLAISFIRKYPKERDNRETAILLGMMFIVLHSIIDFNLSLGSVAILLYLLIGVSGSYGVSTQKALLEPVGRGLASLIVLFVLIIGIWFNSSDNENIEWAFRSGQPIDIAAVEENIKIDVLNSTFHGLIAESNHQGFLQNGKQEQLQQSLASIDKAISLDKYNDRWYRMKARYLMSKGNYSEAAEFARTATELAPKKTVSYETEAQLLFDIYSRLAEENHSEQIMYKEKIEELYKRAETTVEETPAELLTRWRETKPDESKKLLEIVEKMEES